MSNLQYHLQQDKALEDLVGFGRVSDVLVGFSTVLDVLVEFSRVLEVVGS